jgi:hypothetical protein
MFRSALSMRRTLYSINGAERKLVHMIDDLMANSNNFNNDDSYMSGGVVDSVISQALSII